MTPASWLLSLPPDAQQSVCGYQPRRKCRASGAKGAQLVRSRLDVTCKSSPLPFGQPRIMFDLPRWTRQQRLCQPQPREVPSKTADFPQREASVRCRNVPSVAALTLGRFAIVPPRLVMLTPAGARHDAAGSSVRSNRLLDRTLLFTRLSILWCVRLRRSPLPVRML